MKRKHLTLALVMVVAATMMSGCKSYKNLWSEYKTPTDVAIIDEYAKAKELPTDSTSLGNLNWREVFTDPTLQSYIERALTNNTDLKNAKLNIDIAEARLNGAKLAYYPAVTFSPGRAGTKPDKNDMSWGWQLPLTVSWQADIYGQTKNNQRSAKSAVIQTEAYKQAVQSQIIAAVASCYYNMVSLKNQLEILEKNAKLAHETVNTMKDMKESAGYTEVAVVQSQAQYHSIMANVPDVKLGLAQACNTMSLLLNTTPQEWPVNTKSQLLLPAKFNSGVPMSYLATRPDVRSAEQSFAQAYYATNIARANFYPQLSITASGTYGTLLGSTVVDPAKFLLNLAGSLTAPIFDRGRNKATLKAAKLSQEQALNSFQYSILNASKEVSNALVNIDAYRTKQVSVEQQEQALEKAVEYNKDLLSLATTTYLDVISAQQSLLASQITLENVKLNNNLGVITLYQALGGGR